MFYHNDIVRRHGTLFEVHYSEDTKMQIGAIEHRYFIFFCPCSMSPSRSKPIYSSSKQSIISLSSFETSSSLINDPFLVYDHNTNNYQNPISTKSLNQTLDQAVECFEEILNQCAMTPSNASFRRDNDRYEDENVLQSKKRECEEFLRSIDRKENSRSKQREMKVNCRRWCEEQNQTMSKASFRSNRTDRRPYSRNQRNLGSTFFCRKALLQKPDGTTYICIRKQSN